MRKLVLRNFLSPGDIVMLTAAVRDLHQCYPDQFLTDVRTSCPQLWENNPYLTALDENDPEVDVIDCHYPLIERCNRAPYHSLHGFIEFLNERLKLQMKPTAFKGDIHISDLEKLWFSQVHELTGEDTPFWIVVAGGKYDYTIKWWSTARYQEVIDYFRGRILFVQVGELVHHHPRLDGVIDLRGKTDLRQLTRLVYHSQGVLCGVTGLMHLAAAVQTKSGYPINRPCVVIAGGREPVHWEAYPHHQFIHTLGALPCCQNGGCWKSRTLPIGDGDEKDLAQNLCVDVAHELPRCMDMITSAEVIRRIETYFEGGTVHFLTPAEARKAKVGIRLSSGGAASDRLRRSGKANLKSALELRPASPKKKPENCTQRANTPRTSLARERLDHERTDGDCTLESGHAKIRGNRKLRGGLDPRVSRVSTLGLMTSRVTSQGEADLSDRQMLSRVFAIACDSGYYPGLRALLNSIWVYHRRAISVFLYHRGLNESQIAELKLHPCDIRLHALSELPFPSQGMWEAKQQIFAHCIGRARCVYLLDADLVLVSPVDDIFGLAESGKLVSSADGSGVVYDDDYSAYSPRLPGRRQAYINTGALCLDVIRHWDLAGLWGFASPYGAYSPRSGAPLGLPGYGDQGVFNAIAAVLGKEPDFHVLPEGSWCDSRRRCTIQIRDILPDGRLDVWNLTDDTPQRLVHSSGPKWWTAEGAAHLNQFGDKYRCFRHFSELKPAASSRTKILIGVCSSRKTADRRAAVRATWMRQLPEGVLAVFFAGPGAGNNEPDLIQLDAGDDYPSLPSKVHAFCLHALNNYDFDYLFKCDDDTYVVPDRLLDLTAGGAAFVGSSASAPHGYASGGAGYLLSRAAVYAVAEAPAPGAGAEDVWVTGLLRSAGFPLTPSPHLRPGHDELPHPGNAVITAHYCGTEVMTVAYRLMTPGAEPVHILAVLYARHAFWQGPMKLLSDGMFLGGADAPDGHWEWDAATQTLLLRWFHWTAERLSLREWGLEAPNLRLEFAEDGGPAEWRNAVAGQRSPSRSEICKTFSARHTGWTGQLVLLNDGTFRGGLDRPDGRWNLEDDLLTLAWYHWPPSVLRANRSGAWFATGHSDPLTLHEDPIREDDRHQDLHLGGNIHGGDAMTFYPELWKWLVESFSVRSVLDVGCGEGHALAEFEKSGIRALGIDGNRHNVIETTHKGIACLLHDFTKGAPALDEDFDLGWCCEFVEHVEERFLANILAVFKKCRIVAMTHAQPGQGGHHHVNCQPPDYWIDKMVHAGFELLSHETAESRKFYPAAYWGRTGLIFQTIGNR